MTGDKNVESLFFYDFIMKCKRKLYKYLEFNPTV